MSRLPDPGAREGSKMKGTRTMSTTRPSLDRHLKTRESNLHEHLVCTDAHVVGRPSTTSLTTRLLNVS